MKNALALAISLVAAILSSGCRQELKDISSVSFPEAPIEIMCNEDIGMELINYLNIIQLPDGTYRMYFSAIKEKGDGSDWDQNLYYAESTDGFSYEFKGKVMDTIVEQTVFLVDDRDRPFRMVGNILVDGRHNLCLWKSRDGLTFDEKKVLSAEVFDTQNVMIERSGRLRLYTRINLEEGRNRRVAVAEFTLDGEPVSDFKLLPGDFLYNSATCKTDERHDVLFPTYLNDYDGDHAECYIKTFVTDGLYDKEIPCDLNRWIEPGKLWALVAPGFITINGERYLAYNTITKSHGTVRSDAVSKYKLIKAVVGYD